MALDAVLDTLENVPEALHAFYTEEAGKFVLDLSDSIRAHPKVVELRVAFDRVKADRKKIDDELKVAKERLAAIPDAFDPDEYRRLKLEAEEVAKDPTRQRGNDEHLQSQRKVYEQRVEAMKKSHADELAARETALKEKDAVLEDVLVEEGLTKTLVEAGVEKKLLGGAKALLRRSVKVVKDDVTNKYRAVVVTDMGEEDLPKFVANWTQSDEGKPYVAPAQGGGSPGGGPRSISPDNPFSEKHRNLTKQQEIIAADPARARQLAAQAGVKIDNLIN